MKTEEQIKEEMVKQKNAIDNPFQDYTDDDKIHYQIYKTLEWVLNDKERRKY